MQLSQSRKASRLSKVSTPAAFLGSLLYSASCAALDPEDESGIAGTGIHSNSVAKAP